MTCLGSLRERERGALTSRERVHVRNNGGCDGGIPSGQPPSATDSPALLGDAKTLVENLETDLRLFKAFLKDSAIKQRKDDRLRELVRKIRDVVYEAEDIIDAFVTQAAENQSKSYFLRAFQTPVKLHGVATEIERVSAKVKEIYGDKSTIDFASLTVGDGGSEESEAEDT
ncbi:UNVERIFIED_CONTAM: hypothetical protein Sradi_4082300 [Sesamum radiatum]|uniref:Disease resistance N-terminal domain-containing protein n=1 Tax=Sesamum radiatum TaxID=300843 RepID=A0AAW2PKU1_SESRA